MGEGAFGHGVDLYRTRADDLDHQVRASKQLGRVGVGGGPGVEAGAAGAQGLERHEHRVGFRAQVRVEVGQQHSIRKHDAQFRLRGQPIQGCRSGRCHTIMGERFSHVTVHPDLAADEMDGQLLG